MSVDAPQAPTHARSRTTMPPPAVPKHRRRARSQRRIGLALVGLVVLVASANVLGVRHRTVEATTGDTTIRVQFPSIARPGLAVSYEVAVVRTGGFDGPVRIAVDAAFVDLLDINGVLPEPDAELSDGTRVVWEFAAPPGDTLRVVVDSRIEPAAQLEWLDATTGVLDGWRTVVQVAHRSWITP